MGGRGEQANEARIISAKIVVNLQHINSLENYTCVSVFPFQVKTNADHLGQAEQGKDNAFYYWQHLHHVRKKKKKLKNRSVLY